MMICMCLNCPEGLNFSFRGWTENLELIWLYPLTQSKKKKKKKISNGTLIAYLSRGNFYFYLKTKQVMMREETRKKRPITNNDVFIETNVSCSLHRKTRTQLTTEKKKIKILLAFLPFNKSKSTNHQESLCSLQFSPLLKTLPKK